MATIKQLDDLHEFLRTRRGGNPVKSEEIQRRFEIKRSTVYRWIEKLRVRGLTNRKYTIESDKFGYSLQDKDYLNVSFTQEEAASVLIAEKLVESYSDYSIIQNFNLVVDKIKVALRESDCEFIETLSTRTKNQRIQPFQEDMFPYKHLATIQKAITNQNKIYLEYYIFSKDSHSEREIIPIRLKFDPPTWLVSAYCLLKNDYRDFRLDRIKNLEILPEKFETRPEYTEQAYLKDMETKGYKKKIVARLHNSIRRYWHYDIYNFGFVSEKKIADDYTQLEFYTEKEEELIHWLISWGNKADIISPKKLKSKMKILAQEIAKHYGV